MHCTLTNKERAIGKTCRSMECQQCPKYRVTKPTYSVWIDKLDLPDNTFDNWYTEDIIWKLNEVIDYLNSKVN